MFLIGIRVRPSSTVSCTGMSRIMLMSLPAIAPPGVGWKLVNDAGDTWSAGPCSSEAVSLRASTAAQSAAFGSGTPGAAAEWSVAMEFSLLDDEAREVHVLHGVAHRALLRLLRPPGHLVLRRLVGLALGGRDRLGGKDLDAHRPHRLAHDFLGELLLAGPAEQVLRALLRQDQQD